ISSCFTYSTLSLSSSPPGFPIPRNFLNKAENTKHKGNRRQCMAHTSSASSK
ncbi:unnamed protein product, partial [Brassica rapa subsp. narinosa]